MKLLTPPLETLEPMLNESIYHFLTEHQTGRTDFTELSQIFFRLIQTMPDPPLEFIWFYSALTFHTTKHSASLTDSRSLLLTIKDLFHSLTSFHNPLNNNYLNLVSLFAPVVYELVNFSKCELVRFKTEVESLVDALVSYIVTCCGDEFVEGEVIGGGESGSWVSVVPIWIADRVREREGGSRGRVDGLEMFFPLTSEEIRRGFDGECRMEYLAGVVMIEVFLFRLCLMFGSGCSEMELCKGVKSCAVQIIKAFKKNPTFLVMLFKLLLEPSLPVGQLLTATDELLLRRLLFDVALDLGLFLSFDASSPWLSDVKYKEIVILWLFVSSSALQFASENGDDAGVDCYLDAFAASQLPLEIISWVTGVTSIKPTAPDSSSPKDIIGWLLVLEKEGLKICNHSIAELHERAFIDGVKDGESMVEDAPIRIDRIRKRDSAGFGEVQKQIKVMKCFHENLVDAGGKNEVGNSVPDQEMIDMVH